jgi:hypothetical protein
MTFLLVAHNQRDAILWLRQDWRTLHGKTTANRNNATKRDDLVAGFIVIYSMVPFGGY